MGIGLSGLVSGLDTDSIIKALMSAQRTKATKIENKITTNEWKTEKWKDLNTKIYSLYTGTLAKMKTQGNYLAKQTSSSNESLVTATASASAALGTHQVRVVSTASAQYVTGGKTAKSGLTSKSKLSEAGVAVGTIVTVTSGDKKQTLEVTEDTTIADFTSACKSAGLNASFDTTRSCFYISSKESGKENAFQITTSTYADGGFEAKETVNELLNYSEMSTADKEKADKAFEILRGTSSAELDAILNADVSTLSVSELNTLGAWNTIQSLAESYMPGKLAQDEVYGNIRDMIVNGTDSVYGIEYARENYTKLETQAAETARAEYQQQVFEAVYGSDFDSFDTEVTYDTIKEIEAKVAKMQNGEAVTLTEEEKNILSVYQTKSAEFASELQAQNSEYTKLYDKELERLVEIDVKYYYKNSEDAKTALTEREAALKAAGQSDSDMAAAFSELKTSLYSYVDASATTGVNGLAALGLGDIDGSAMSASSNAYEMAVVAGSNAQVEVDGALMDAESNTVTVNGLTLNIKMANPGETVNITVSKNVDKVYDMVKEFVKEYNELLGELNTAYYAESAYGYDPLTDEQKDAMSDSEVEKWETKIKDSLLRRDNTLGSLITSMRTCLSGSVEVNGKKYSLSSFGICTTDYTEKGKLHIYGDSEDSGGALYDDKLRAAIEEDPDTVMQVIQGLSQQLYDTMSDKMKSTTLSSALTFYNDKQLTKELTSYKEDLAEMEERLQDMEDRYYKQFTAMEKSLSQLNSSANSLASMLGLNTSN